MLEPCDIGKEEPIEVARATASAGAGRKHIASVWHGKHGDVTPASGHDARSWIGQLSLLCWPSASGHQRQLGAGWSLALRPLRLVQQVLHSEKLTRASLLTCTDIQSALLERVEPASGVFEGTLRKRDTFGKGQSRDFEGHETGHDM